MRAYGIIVTFAAFARSADAASFLRVRGDTPQYFTDPSTSKFCTWYHDNADDSVACADVPALYGISKEDFLRWNPTIGSNCAGYNSFQSYCVEAFNEPTGSPTPTPTSTPSSSPTSSAGNGITTPQPTQPGMVSNCNKFHFVKPDQGCSEITALNGITFAQLLAWNTGIGSNCEALWANTNVCVGIIGSTPTPTSTPSKTTSPPTTPTPTNGVTTPLPTQPGMVSDCDRFYFVNSGDICEKIATSNGISVSDFVKWNPGVGSDCSKMWANAYVCVRVIGFRPPTTTTTRPSTTTTGNGISTPTPTQVGMVSNCNK
ncbi:unnamed protein product [Periconia digitata]|uniref:LysM domain-containing protein n=1 Tax=Periconia digitata TaxID=1303443 RepID=A0A9W4U8M0_9PLEO|nr:unnamed protein product [Periconia digitata]